VKEVNQQKIYMQGVVRLGFRLAHDSAQSNVTQESTAITKNWGVSYRLEWLSGMGRRDPKHFKGIATGDLEEMVRNVLD
jgi:hypothetical protein